MPESMHGKFCAQIDEEHDHVEWCPKLDRRAAMRLFGVAALANVAGCSSNVSASSATTTTGTTSTTTTLAASSTSVATGASVTLTATVSPSAAAGTVTFYSGTTALGSATLSSGVATLATSFSSSGTLTLTAVYAGNSVYAASTSAAVTLTVTGTTGSCSVTLEGEEGPYFVDDSATGFLRSNILSNLDGSSTQTGIPLVLTIYVYDAKSSCSPMQSVQVDIWHCNASGIYSDESVESTLGQTWLRGYQITDSTGKVTFTTIVPGWYQGRTTHIHLRLRSTYDETSNSGTNTTQIFFNQTLIDTIDTTIAPYSAEGQNSTTNASDHVYTGETNGTNVLSLSGSVSAGFTATANFYLP